MGENEKSKVTGNINEELNRRNIGFLNVKVDLPEKNKFRVSFGGIHKGFFKGAKLVESSFKYDPFEERCETSFEDIEKSTEASVRKSAPKTDEKSLVSGFEYGTWDNTKKTLTLNNSFKRPGIYTGVIEVNKDYKKLPDNYVVSFKKLPNDYIGYESLEITAGKLIITDLYVSDGHKCVRLDKLDEIKITYDKHTVTITPTKDNDKKKYISDKNQQTVMALVNQDEKNQKNITVNLLELSDFGKLEKNKILKINVKYFGVYEVNAFILLLEEKAKVDFPNIFVTNKGLSAVKLSFSSVFGSSTPSITFSSEKNSTVSGVLKLGTYSVAKFEQTYGDSTNVLGGAELYIRSMVDTSSHISSIAVFINNPAISVAKADRTAIVNFKSKGRSETPKVKLSEYPRNPVVSSTSSHFVYTHHLSSYSMSTNPVNSSGVSGLIGEYFYQVGTSLPQLYFDATKYLDIHSVVSTAGGSSSSSVYFTFNTESAKKDQEEKNKILTAQGKIQKVSLYDEVRFKKSSTKRDDIIKAETSLSTIPSNIAVSLVTGFYAQWKTPSAHIGITNSAFNHGYNPVVVSFTSDVKKFGSTLSAVLKSAASTGSGLMYTTTKSIPTVVKTTIMLPIDKIKGYNITPKIEQLSSSEFNVKIQNVEDLLERINKEKSSENLDKFKFKFNNVEFNPKKDSVQTLDEQKNKDILFDVNLGSSVTNDFLDWELLYSSQKIICDKYNVPKIESVNLSKFQVFENKTKSGVDIFAEFDGFKIQTSETNIKANIKFEVGKKAEGNGKQLLGEGNKKYDTLSALSGVKGIGIDDFDKIVSVSLEYKEKELNEKCKKEKLSALFNAVNIKLKGNVKKLNKVNQVTDCKAKHKYQGIYRAGVVIEKEPFTISLTQEIKSENSVEVIVSPEILDNFKLERIVSGKVYYRKKGKNDSYKTLDLILDENKQGKVLIDKLENNVKYELIATYDYSTESKDNEIENRVYSPQGWILILAFS